MAKLQPLSDQSREVIKAMFALPEHWSVECAHFAFNEVRDGTHDSPKQFDGEGFPLVTSKNLKESGLDFQNTKNISAEDHFEISKRSKVESGDILFSMIGTIGNVSIIESETDFSIKNVGLFRKSTQLLTPKFSYYWLKSHTYQNWLDSRKRGGTQKFVSLGILRESPIVIAPLAEQKRIVEKLDEVLAQVDTIKARLDGIPDLLKRFRQSVLASAVSGKLTKEWRGDAEKAWKNGIKLDSLCESSFYGPRFSKDDYSDVGIPTIRTTDMTAKGGINVTPDTPRIVVPDEKMEQFKVNKGDLLVTRTGSVGVMAIFTGDYLAIPSAT